MGCRGVWERSEVGVILLEATTLIYIKVVDSLKVVDLVRLVGGIIRGGFRLLG